MQILKADSRTTINWASGTSTEIFIYPSDGSFAERNFRFRISTATVEAEESNFTFFEGITRHLMILKGELELIHEGRYSKHLKPFEQDTFSGEWNTRSKGKVTDFNLMLKGESKGSLQYHRLESGLTKSFQAKAGFYFIYIVAGTALCNGSYAHTGDLICFAKNENVVVNTKETCDLIEIEVSLADKP